MTNIPGVLAAATVLEYGGISNAWGACVSTKTASKVSTGQYRVYHAVGHSEYTVQITPHVYSSNQWCTMANIINKTSGSFELLMRNDDGNGADAAFDYMIIGYN